MAHTIHTFTSPYGYRIVRTSDGRQLSEHRYVWERAHGPIPPGIEIHHRNGLKTDNRLENLQAVDSLAHKKLHAGIRMNDAGELVKKCRTCGQVKSVQGGYYRHPRAAEGYVYPRCRKCHVAAVVRSEQRARAGETRPRFKKWRPWMETPETARAVIAKADLSDRQRAVLTGLVVERKKMRAVAEEIGVSTGIVSRHLGRAVDQVDASGS